MIPIIVDKILAKLKIPYQGMRTDRAVLYKEIEFDRVINTFERVIFLLGLVLKKTSGLLDAQTMGKRMVTSCQTPLYQSEELLKEIALKIYGPKSRLKGLQVESITKKIEDPELRIQKKRESKNDL